MPRLQAKNLESRAVFYTLFRSIFDRFKKSEGRFLLLELGKLRFLQTNLFSKSILGCSLFNEIAVLDVAC